MPPAGAKPLRHKDFASAEARRGLSDRPLHPFGANTLLTPKEHTYKEDTHHG